MLKPFGEPPDPTYPIPLTHVGCGALLLWHVELPAPKAGVILYAQNVIRPDGTYPNIDDVIGRCPDCEERIQVWDITWER